MLNSTDTVETVDLFNNLDRVVITNFEPNDYWRERRRVDGPAHNPRPRAPEHLTMLNNLIGDRAKKTPTTAESHKKIRPHEWKGLREHAEHLALPPTRCCFQCGMLNYPRDGEIILVQNISQKADCRAYRVFKYYIRELIHKMRERHPDHTTDRDAVNQIFLCEPAKGGGCRVYACNACKRLCRSREGQRTT